MKTTLIQSKSHGKTIVCLTFNLVDAEYGAAALRLVRFD
jgi:hypothetical protein